MRFEQKVFLYTKALTLGKKKKDIEPLNPFKEIDVKKEYVLIKKGLSSLSYRQREGVLFHVDYLRAHREELKKKKAAEKEKEAAKDA